MLTTAVQARVTYTCWGPLRGGCGHRHESIGAAADCLRADQRRCNRQQRPEFCDRDIRGLDPGDNLTEPGPRAPGWLERSGLNV